MFVAVLVCVSASLHAQGPKTVSEQYLFQAVNQERAERGLSPLRWDESLGRAAANHVVEMAKRQSISHQYTGEPELSARGKLAGAHFSTIAENVAMSPTAVGIHTAWMNSPGHRANILDPRVDSVAIRVLARNGELYAVEDFDRSVEAMTLDEQEDRVASLILSRASLDLLPASEESRRTCAMSTGYAGPQQPWFVVRYTASDLTHLPEQLTSRLQTGKYHHAAVGACETNPKQEFTTFKIAVMLYP